MEHDYFDTREDDSIIETIKRGEKLGYIVLPFKFSKRNREIMDRWFNNRCRRGKPCIQISLKPDGTGQIHVDFISSYGRAHIKNQVKEVHEQLMDTYIALPRSLTKGLYTRSGVYWFRNTEDLIQAAFPSGDKTIIECILTHLTEAITQPDFVTEETMSLESIAL
ncbi:hypothetical protein AB4Z22_00150 [Paenibacillus sp. TAF58]